MEQNNWGNCCEYGADLKREDRQREPRNLRQPLNCKERNYGKLKAHEQLPEVSGSAFIGFSDDAKNYNVSTHNNQGSS